jgi:segregation and condensation protein B
MAKNDKEHAQPTPQSENAAIAESKPSPAGAVSFAPERRAAAVEAVLLAVDKPLSPAKVAQAIGIDDPAAVRTLIHELNESYEASGRSFRIEQVAGGYRILTLPEFAPAVAAIRGLRESAKLSRAAVETLAIIAYKQPITRVQVEAIRGVASGEVIRTLLDRRLVAIIGRAEELGRPMLYGTSKQFLETFGLSSTKDLPRVTDLFPGTDPTAADEKAGPTHTTSANPAEPDDASSDEPS